MARIFKTLFLNEKDYKTFLDFMHLINDLARNFDEVEIDELQEAVDNLVKNMAVKKEED